MSHSRAVLADGPRHADVEHRRRRHAPPARRPRPSRSRSGAARSRCWRCRSGLSLMRGAQWWGELRRARWPVWVFGPVLGGDVHRLHGGDHADHGGQCAGHAVRRAAGSPRCSRAWCCITSCRAAPGWPSRWQAPASRGCSAAQMQLGTRRVGRHGGGAGRAAGRRRQLDAAAAHRARQRRPRRTSRTTCCLPAWIGAVLSSLATVAPGLAVCTLRPRPALLALLGIAQLAIPCLLLWSTRACRPRSRASVLMASSDSRRGCSPVRPRGGDLWRRLSAGGLVAKTSRWRMRALPAAVRSRLRLCHAA